MNNNRYEADAPSWLRALALALAAACALVLTVNALRLLGVVPDVEALRLAAPLGATFGFLSIVTVLLLTRPADGRGAPAVTVTGLAAATATAALAVIEVITHYVLTPLPAQARSVALAGPLMAFLAVASLGFALAVVAFAVALNVGGHVPLLPLAVWSAGAVLLGLRAFLPGAAGAVGVIAVGVGTLLVVSALSGRHHAAVAV